MEAGAELTEGRARLQPVVLAPPEVADVLLLISGHETQVLRQLLNAIEAIRIDVGVRRQEAAVVGAAKDDGHNVALQCIIELLGDIVRAQRVLKGQIKQIVRVQHLVAVRIVACTAASRIELVLCQS